MMLLFPTVIHQIKVDNFKSIKNDLIKFVYWEREEDPHGVNFSNVGGWQSKGTYHQFDNILLSTVTNALTSYFSNDVLDMEREIKCDGMWMNINKKGDYNATHNHPGCHLAGVFWIQSPKGCGNIELQNPNSFPMGHEMMRYTEKFQKKSSAYPVYMFPPTEGTLLLFPACINHRVSASQSDEDRISVAFNLSLAL